MLAVFGLSVMGNPAPISMLSVDVSLLGVIYLQPTVPMPFHAQKLHKGESDGSFCLVMSAAGPSLDADMGTAERAAPAEPESKLDALTSAHGVSRDVAQRYLMAANDELAATHRLLQTSRVRVHPAPSPASSDCIPHPAQGSALFHPTQKLLSCVLARLSSSQTAVTLHAVMMSQGIK